MRCGKPVMSYEFSGPHILYLVWAHHFADKNRKIKDSTFFFAFLLFMLNIIKKSISLEKLDIVLRNGI
jgi:hypothetical protein